MITDKLLQAISEKDWGLVREVYSTLSGNSIPENNAVTNQKQRRKKSVKSVEKTSRPIRKNLFESMDIRIEKELGENKINDKVKPTPRTRKPYTPVSISCDGCNKQFEVAPIFAKENYKCDTCLMKGK